MNSAQNAIRVRYEEYRAFDKAYCRAALSSLRRQGALSESQPSLESDEDPSRRPCVNRSDGEFVFDDFGDEEEELPVGIAHVDTRKFEADATFQPHPAYELCSSIARNIKVGDDPDYMPFAPFSDDPSFKFLDYNEEYTWLAWQPPKMFDPDCRSTFDSKKAVS
jgi:histone-lysine N-methyltransferase EZH2